MPMRKLLALLLVVPSVAFGQDLGMYNRGLSAFNGGDYDAAAQVFYELTETSTDQAMRSKAEYYLAQSFQKRGLPVLAFIYYTGILKAGKAHPHYLKAVEGLVNLQQELDDQYLIPNLLNNEYNEEWATLPLEVLARINFLIGGISRSRSKFEEAKAFLDAVPKESAVYAKARYLLGIVLIDPKYPGGPKADEAIKRFEEVLATTSPNQQDLIPTQQLAMLGAGRTYYGARQYPKAVEMYERVPRFSRFWDQALFENGFARFQNEDVGGALGSLQALHAPQFAGAFQPESWILKATAYYFACLYEEAKTALKAFDELYLPMAEQLKPLVEGEEKDMKTYFQLVSTDSSDRVPRPVLLWVRSNERMLGIFTMLAEIDKEKDAIAQNAAWKGAKMGAELTNYLDQNKNTLTQVAGKFAKNRLLEAYRNIKGFSASAQLIRFETSKAEKELFEAGVDQSTLLKRQTLYRPKMPAENWNYWKFQGEFWIDEIGYYQYTLKNGCQAERE